MTPTVSKPALETWTPERQKEVNEATKENPVRLTDDEQREMREAIPNGLQLGVGAGRFMIKAHPGSNPDKALKLKDKGMNTEAIAAELGLDARGVKRMLERVY